MLGEHGGVTQCRSRVLDVALRARDLLGDDHQRNGRSDIVDDGSDDKVRSGCTVHEPAVV